MGKRLNITEEQKKELLHEIKNHLKLPGPLMPILHEAQRIFGCIPVEVQKIVSENTVNYQQLCGIYELRPIFYCNTVDTFSYG